MQVMAYSMLHETSHKAVVYSLHDHQLGTSYYNISRFRYNIPQEQYETTKLLLY